MIYEWNTSLEFINGIRTDSYNVLLRYKRITVEHLTYVCVMKTVVDNYAIIMWNHKRLHRFKEAQSDPNVFHIAPAKQ